MGRKLKIFLGIVFLSVLTAVCSVNSIAMSMVSEGVHEPDGGGNEVYAFEAAECNRVVNVTCQDESGRILRTLKIHTKYGDDNSGFYLGIYGYDIVRFVSNQGLWENCELVWTSANSGKNADIYVNYSFINSLSKNELDITVTMRKSEPIKLVSRHYIQTIVDGKLKYEFLSLSYEMVEYGDYVSLSEIPIKGYHLADGYEANIAGNLSYEWKEKYKNIGSIHSEYVPVHGDKSFSNYDEKRDGKLSHSINRVYNVDFYYNINQYEISFSANGGSGAPESVIKYHDVALVLPDTVPVRDGYTFLGWALEPYSAFALYQPGDVYTSNTGRTLYALWASKDAKTYPILYEPNGGTGAPAMQRKTHGVDIRLSEDMPKRAGYIFLGWVSDYWQTSPVYYPGDLYTKDEGVLLHALWQKAPDYPVIYDANGGVSPPAAQVKVHDAALILSGEIPERKDYIFLGWNTEKNALRIDYNPGDVYEGNAALTLHAVWKYDPPVSYIVSYNANGGISPPAAQVKIHDEPLVLSEDIPERENYKFKGWSIEKSALSIDYTPGDVYEENADLALFAVWSDPPEVYEICFVDDSGVPTWDYKTEGEPYIISSRIPTRNNSNFLGWSAGKSNNVADYQPGDVYDIDAPMTFFAVWDNYYDFILWKMTVSATEVNSYDTITVTIEVRSRDMYNVYNDVPIHILLGGKVVKIIYVDFPHYLSYPKVTVQLNVGGLSGTVMLEAWINMEDRGKEVYAYDNNYLIGLRIKGVTYDVSMEPVELTDTSENRYISGDTVISSYLAYNNGELDILPKDKNTAKFRAYYLDNGRQVDISVQYWRDVVIPAHGANLVYFRWTIPRELSGKEIICECTINADRSLFEDNYENNTAGIRKRAARDEISVTPDTRFESKPAGWQRPNTPENTAKELSWTMWEYADGEYVLKKYGIKLNGIASLSSDEAATLNGVKTLGSGYGVMLDFVPLISVVEGCLKPDSSAYTAVQGVYARYPEWRYTTAPGCYSTLYNTAGTWRFGANPDADGSARVHFVPVWYPDGYYSVSVTAGRVWTPAGAVTSIFSASIRIQGTLYDDWYQR